MANTKVTGDLIASGTITAANLVSGALDGLLNTYLTTNTYATESYVTTAVSNLIDAAPGSLDTLNELAAALNDDANFATTVTNALATKLNLSGGTISGNLTVSGTITGDVTGTLSTVSVTAHSDVTNAGSGAIITTVERDKLTGIESGAEVNTVDSVNGETGVVVLDADDIDDTSTTHKFTSQTDIDKLAGIEAGAEVNVVDSVNTQTGAVVLDADDIDDTSTTHKFTSQTDIDKLAGIEAGAEVNDIDGSGTANTITKWSDSDTITDSSITDDGTTVTITGDVSIADKIIHTGDTNTAIRFPAADTVTIETSGSERVRVDSSGNVLVGTTNIDVGGTVTGFRVVQNGQVYSSTDSTTFGIQPLYLDRRGTNNTGDSIMLAMGGFFKSSIGVLGTNSTANNGGITFNTISANVTKTERVRIDIDGLKFNGDTAAANALNDYEEGTWTIGLAAGTSGTITLNASFDTGQYTKIGRQVTVTGLAVISSVASPVGGVVITGLPFTRGSGTSNRGVSALTYLNAPAYEPNQLSTIGTEGQTTISIVSDASTFASTDEIIFTHTYFTA